ncbi:hypothetical protein LPA45_09885 [Cupriavidus sp. Agwp_2]
MSRAAAVVVVAMATTPVAPADRAARLVVAVAAAMVPRALPAALVQVARSASPTRR